MYHTEEVGQKLIVQLPGKYVKDAHLKTGGPHRIKGVAQSRAKLFTIIEVNDILVAHVQHNYLPRFPHYMLIIYFIQVKLKGTLECCMTSEKGTPLKLTSPRLPEVLLYCRRKTWD